MQAFSYLFNHSSIFYYKIYIFALNVYMHFGRLTRRKGDLSNSARLKEAFESGSFLRYSKRVLMLIPDRCLLDVPHDI